MKQFDIVSAEAMEQFGALLSKIVTASDIVFLSGDLGAGKTTLVRGLLYAFGHEGNVKSPTYTIVEKYSLKNNEIYHFDLYRLNDPEELEAMGIRDYFESHAICLFEWPERAQEILPKPSINIDISVFGESRKLIINASTLQLEKICQN